MAYHKILLLCICLAVSALAKKSNVAVLDISGNFKDFSKDELASITGRFETELIKTDTYTVLERRNVDIILQEQGFQASGVCNTSECQVEIGQLLGVEKIITGNISKVNELISINLKMVDVGSGKNELSHALDIRGNIETVLRGGCWELAQIFGRKKSPANSHTVLTEEGGSIWPWIVGGAATVVASVAVIMLMSQDSGDKVEVIDRFPVEGALP